MKISTILRNKKKRIPLWTIPVWLLIWQLLSMWLGHEILLASPLLVWRCLISLIVTVDFWQTIWFSFGRIVLGFLLAAFFGIVFASLASVVKVIRELLALPIAVLKATPVASFIILVLIWLPAKNLAILISFIMAFPIIYTNLYTGITAMDKNLLEMAKVFRVPFSKRFRYLYLSQVMPYFSSACTIAIGMCWKAGIAAEIIGIPNGSMGERLYHAKIYLETPELFAWTIVIISISVLFEKAFLFLLHKIDPDKKAEGTAR